MNNVEKYKDSSKEVTTFDSFILRALKYSRTLFPQKFYVHRYSYYMVLIRKFVGGEAEMQYFYYREKILSSPKKCMLLDHIVTEF